MVHVVHIDAPKPELPVERELLTRAGIEFSCEQCTTDAEVVAAARTADGILCVGYRLTRAVLEQCERLKVIVRYGVGTDNVDVAAANERGIAVCNVPDYCVDEVANHTMAMLLALNRRLIAQDRAIRSGWHVPLRPTGGLRGETLGLVGCGRLGQAVAERARAFGMHIVGFDRYATLPLELGIEPLDLDDVLRQSDYVSVHVPLTTATRGMLGEPQFRLMKPTAYLLSTARGGIISEAALDRALELGLIAGAGLDVWDSEPVDPNNTLLRRDNVIGTNHTAFYSDRALDRLRRRVCDAAIGMLTGAGYEHVINADALA